MIFGSLLGAGASILGANSAKKAADADRALRREQMDRLAGVEFNPFNTNISGFGNFGVSFDPGSGAPIFNLGGFENIFGNLGNAAGAGLAQGQAAQRAALGGIDPNSPLFASALSAQAFGQAGNLGANGFQRALQGQLFGQAGALAGQTDFGQLEADRLSQLRSQAQPFEERAFSNLQDNLFATGRLGSTGGALQTEAFARGLAQADVGRQVAAGDFAQSQQAQNANIANTFAGVGSSLAGLENNLLTSAFSRFGQTAGLAQDLNVGRFQLGSSLFNQGLQGLSGQQSVLSNLLGFGEFGANLGAQRASTDLAAAGGAANVPLGASGRDVQANFLSTLGSNLLGSNGLSNIGSGIKNIFSGFGKPQGASNGVFVDGGLVA